MSDVTIVCPHCNGKLPLTESLAAPLLAATRREYEQKLTAKDADVRGREQALVQREHQLEAGKRALDRQVAEQVAEKVIEETTRIAADEARKAKLASAVEIAAKANENKELREVLQTQEQKLAEAQKAQADVLRQKRELDDAKRELGLEVERGIQAGLAEARERAKGEVEEGLKLKVLEKDQTIASMQKKIEELKQKAEQGSQQRQGEAQELALENLLRTTFPVDAISPVPKGHFGGDLLHSVAGPNGQPCGTILWESKRTKNWSDSWLAKLRDDQRAANAEICVLVSQALPKGVDTFTLIDGVWVAAPSAAVALAVALRVTLAEVSCARATSEGQQTKTAMVYQYLVGSRFKQRVEALVESFMSMQTDLEKERRATERQWAKRQMQIDRMMKATVGMYGDLQGIAGKSLPEIAGLDFDEPARLPPPRPVTDDMSVDETF